MLDIERQLATDLKSHGVRFDVVDKSTVVFRNVPISGKHFSKPCTNMLVRRLRGESAYLSFVDEDLAYRGSDKGLVRAFAAGPTQEGWRALLLADVSPRDFETTVRQSLAALGFPDGEPESMPAPEREPRAKPSLLNAFGRNLTNDIESAGGEPTVGRRIEAETVASCLLRWSQARVPVVIGDSGVGKSNLFFALAAVLKEWKPDLKLVVVDAAELLAGTVFDAEREKLLARVLLEDVTPDTVLALDHLERTTMGAPRGQHLLAQATDRGARVMGTILPEFVPLFQRAPLARRIQFVPLREPTGREAADVLRALIDSVASHHGVEIDENVIPVCVREAQNLPGVYPAKAITLLDDAATTASVLRMPTVGTRDIVSAATRWRAAIEDKEDE
jgi:ATP-dependent Clp protease ATP-binding subunit ClpA